ncbi:hypothetical protein [Spirillospora sp. CA-128828]|uniref:hypothetical protein n=1 Tax=Spirillospora sp. CA-128828 TaxID=3240033 RepID=UPI003D8EDCCB
MSTRMLGLITTAAAISAALTGGVAAAANASFTAPPPSAPHENSASDAKPVPDPQTAPDPMAAPDPQAAPDPKTAPDANALPDLNGALDQDAAPDPNAAQQDPAAPKAAAPKAKPVAKDGTDLSACRDADCQVQIKGGEKITLDRKYGLDPIHVKLHGSQVIFVIRGRGSNMTTSVDAAWPNSTAVYNGISLRPHRAKDGSMILNISHD